MVYYAEYILHVYSKRSPMGDIYYMYIVNVPPWGKVYYIVNLPMGGG
jgi:hypothetical protein